MVCLTTPSDDWTMKTSFVWHPRHWTMVRLSVSGLYYYLCDVTRFFLELLWLLNDYHNCSAYVRCVRGLLLSNDLGWLSHDVQMNPNVGSMTWRWQHLQGCSWGIALLSGSRDLLFILMLSNMFSITFYDGSTIDQWGCCHSFIGMFAVSSCCSYMNLIHSSLCMCESYLSITFPWLLYAYPWIQYDVRRVVV